MERRGWDEKKDWGRGKREAARAWGGGFMREKAKQARNGGGWGPWSCPPPRTLGPSTLGAQGAPCPGSQGNGRLTHWAGQTGRTLLSLSSAAACGLHHPKKRRGPSVPHNRTVSTAKGQTAHLPLIPSALLPSNCKTNANTQPSLVQPDPPEFLTSNESESGRRRKQFASSSQMGAKCKNS